MDFHKLSSNIYVLGAVLFVCLLVLIGYMQGGPSRTSTSGSESTLDRRALLLPPAEGNEYAYESQVEKAAQFSEVLLIGEGCTISPTVLRLREDTNLNIRNNDSVLHTIVFEDKDMFTISPYDARKVKISSVFNKVEGVYRFRCNESAVGGNTGVLYITS